MKAGTAMDIYVATIKDPITAEKIKLKAETVQELRKDVIDEVKQLRHDTSYALSLTGLTFAIAVVFMSLAASIHPYGALLIIVVVIVSAVYIPQDYNYIKRAWYAWRCALAWKEELERIDADKRASDAIIPPEE